MLQLGCDGGDKSVDFAFRIAGARPDISRFDIQDMLSAFASFVALSSDPRNREIQEAGNIFVVIKCGFDQWRFPLVWTSESPGARSSRPEFKCSK